MPTTVARRPVVIIVRDGWGQNPYPQWNQANAVYLAKHPVADRLMAEYPSTTIHTSGFDVGLPEGTMGNSEVGHQNIGAGRIVDQESVKITKEVRSGAFLSNPQMVAAGDNVLANGSALHIFGIVSDAGVHGQLEHLYGCLELAKHKGLTRVFLHAFTDGRDTSPHSGIAYVKQVEAKMTEIGVGRIASVSGRFYAMDRDNRWVRVEQAYRAIAFGEGAKFPTALDAVQHYYDHPSKPNMTGDEFVTPSVMCDEGVPIATVKNGDSVIFYNYRGDRPREIAKAFVMDPFPYTETVELDPPGQQLPAGDPGKIKSVISHGFENRGPKLNLYFVTMTAYESGLPVHVAYPKPPKMKNTLAEYISGLGLRQFRCAETEKFPHVTFFFNDYRETPFPGEDRQIVPSVTDVSTYDQKPEMSAQGICDEVVKRIDSGQYDLIVVNFANPDMVGHTGVLPAAIKAVEFVDARVGDVLAAVERQNGAAIILADHGNCEQMIDPATGSPHTSHTIYDVEIIVADDRFKGHKLRSTGRLADVAPTALQLLGLPKPDEMTGESLLV